MPREGHVSLWHPWKDRPGQRHIPILWGDMRENFTDVEDLVQAVGQSQMYVFCNDILDEQELSMSEDLLRHKNTTSYISRTGKVVALKVRAKRTSGFFIPSSVWCQKQGPDQKLLKNVNTTFTNFGYEALTPASLSEKVLRGTLPERLFISRPSVMLRRSLLFHSVGGRIDTVQVPKHYQKIFNYDQNKSYLYHSRCVPSPFSAPLYVYYGTDNHHGWCNYLDFPASWMLCYLTAHYTGISPIQVKDSDLGVMRDPYQGESFTRWMWNDELLDCIEAGFTVDSIDGCYAWKQTSSFMQEWSDILWQKYGTAENEQQLDIIKTMMVGLPGRFLKSPEVFTLVHQSEGIKEKDVPVVSHWYPGSAVSTPWFIRATEDKESAQLTPIGSYIVMKCRQEIYRKMKEEEKRGNEVIRSYIDCYTTAAPTTIPEQLGLDRGQFKEKIDHDVWVEENRVIPALFSRVKASGFNSTERRELWGKYHASTMKG